MDSNVCRLTSRDPSESFKPTTAVNIGLWCVLLSVGTVPSGDQTSVVTMKSMMSSIATGALAIVITFIAPRDLYNTAFLSKELMSKVTVEMVHYSAMMNVGGVKKTTDKLVGLM